MKKIDPHGLDIFEQLKEKARQNGHISPSKELAHPERMDRMSHLLGNMYVDYSKQLIGLDTLNLLSQMAQTLKLEEAKESLANGGVRNASGQPLALHMALRSRKDKEILQTLEQMKTFCRDVISEKKKGFKGLPIENVVNIGIGGSALGPCMASEALSYEKNRINLHFVSNGDGHHLDLVLKKLIPETTLFIVSSKSFTTLETMLNFNAAKQWLLQGQRWEECRKHFVAVTTQVKKALEFDIPEEHIFKLPEEVGGRFSIWGSVGLSLALGVGFEKFSQLLDGAKEMDRHFLTAKVESNLPVQGALLNFWNTTLLGHGTWGILPYDQRLCHFPDYLGQLVMESNGKSTDRNEKRVSYQTAPVVWGGVGTNGQHAFFQLLHQGTQIVPCDFIVTAKVKHPYREHHEWVLANCLAQTRALFLGKSEEDEEAMIPFKTFEGKRPSTTIILKELTPFTLGMLMAFYEHQVFCLGHLQNICSFRSMGSGVGQGLGQGNSRCLEKYNLRSINRQATRNFIFFLLGR